MPWLLTLPGQQQPFKTYDLNIDIKRLSTGFVWLVFALICFELHIWVVVVQALWYQLVVKMKNLAFMQINGNIMKYNVVLNGNKV